MGNSITLKGVGFYESQCYITTSFRVNMVFKRHLPTAALTIASVLTLKEEEKKVHREISCPNSYDIEIFIRMSDPIGFSLS